MAAKIAMQDTSRRRPKLSSRRVTTHSSVRSSNKVTHYAYKASNWNPGEVMVPEKPSYHSGSQQVTEMGNTDKQPDFGADFHNSRERTPRAIEDPISMHGDSKRTKYSGEYASSLLHVSAPSFSPSAPMVQEPLGMLNSIQSPPRNSHSVQSAHFPAIQPVSCHVERTSGMESLPKSMKIRRLNSPEDSQRSSDFPPIKLPKLELTPPSPERPYCTSGGTLRSFETNLTPILFFDQGVEIREPTQHVRPKSQKPGPEHNLNSSQFKFQETCTSELSKQIMQFKNCIHENDCYAPAVDDFIGLLDSTLECGDDWLLLA